MRYQDIRDAFKKCGVFVNHSGITLVFQKYSPERWITVSVDDEEFDNMRVFQDLAMESRGMSISMFPNRYVGFSFGIELPIDEDRVFPPIQNELTPEEYKRLILMTPPENQDRARDFREFLSHANFVDEYEMLDGISSYLAEQEKGKLLPISSVQRWKMIEPAARSFAKSAGFLNFELTPPSKDLEFGIVDFSFHAEEDRVFKIGIDSKESFMQMISLSTGLSLEAGVYESEANFTMSLFS